MSCSSTLARPSCNALPQYGAYELDDWWSSRWLGRRGGEGGGGGARGDGDEEEMKRVEGDDTWRPGTPMPVAPLHLCLFNYLLHLNLLHAQNGYAYASAPSSPVHAGRPTLARFEDPQAWETTREDGAGPATADPVHSTTARPRTSHLIPLERVLPTQQQQGTGMGMTEEPTPETWRVKQMLSFDYFGISPSTRA